MAVRTLTTTKDYLISTPLPQATETYTVIEHGFVINKTLELLASKGFEVKNELYRCNQSGELAQGVYHLNYGSDPDMGMMFAWSNSYNKQMRFKCAIGGYVFVCMNGMVSGNMGSWGRVHTGNAHQETNDTITLQIDSADLYYNQLVKDKESMKTITVDKKKTAELVGRLFLEHGLLGLEQVSIVKQEINKPSYQYTGPADSLWVLYNHITHSLKKSSPRIWMDQQRLIHWFLTDEFGIKDDSITTVNNVDIVHPPKVISNQIDLLDSIQEIQANG